MAEAISIPKWMGDVSPEQIGFPLAVDKSLYCKRAGIAYKETPAGPLLLDAYRPAAEGRHPLVVMIHGGGWARGGRFDMGLTKWAGYLASAGLAVVSIDYRLAPETRYPDSFRDCLDAVDWAVDNAADLGADPERIGLWGDSAGGHLALLLATSQTNPSYSGPRLRSDGERLRAAVAFYPPTDLFACTAPSSAAASRRRCSISSASSPRPIRSDGGRRPPASRCIAACRRSCFCRGHAISWCRTRRRSASRRSSRRSAHRTSSISSRTACTASIAWRRRPRR